MEKSGVPANVGAGFAGDGPLSGPGPAAPGIASKAGSHKKQWSLRCRYSQ